MKKKAFINKWYIRRLIRLEKHRLKRKNKNPSNIPYRSYKEAKPNPREFLLTLPTDFSLICNRDETCQFFTKALDKICNAKSDINLYFNMHDVKHVTADAIMYLLAVIMNAKHSSAYKVNLSGNSPSDPKCFNALEQAGFFNYVYNKGASDLHPQKKGPYIIRRGHKVDAGVAKELCAYTNSITDYDRIKTKPLFSVIGELMTNSVQHAYSDSESEMIPQWYICVEESDDDIRFVFLDTGEGIPSTAQKRWPEKFFGSVLTGDEDIIKSAFLGELRTRTMLENRGKGLPSIYENCQHGIIDHASVLSRNGYCSIDSKNDYNIIAERLQFKLTGTLFTWLIKKGETKNDQNKDCH